MRRHLAAFGRFWWDFLVGDDWRIVAGVVTALGLGAVLAATEATSDAVVALVVTAGLAIATMLTLTVRPTNRG